MSSQSLSKDDYDWKSELIGCFDKDDSNDVDYDYYDEDYDVHSDENDDDYHLCDVVEEEVVEVKGDSEIIECYLDQISEEDESSRIDFIKQEKVDIDDDIDVIEEEEVEVDIPPNELLPDGLQKIQEPENNEYRLEENTVDVDDIKEEKVDIDVGMEADPIDDGDEDYIPDRDEEVLEEQAMSSDDDDDVFPKECPNCFKTYLTRGAYKSHLRRNACERNIESRQRYGTYRGQWTVKPVRRRRKNALIKDMYPKECSVCYKTYYCKRSFDLHIMRSRCTKNLRKMEEPERIKRMHSPNKYKTNYTYQYVTYPRTCKTCGDTYETKPEYFEHKRLTGCRETPLVQRGDEEANKFLCSNCGSIYRSKQYYLKHVRSRVCIDAPKEDIQYPRKCRDCGIKYNTRDRYYKHRYDGRCQSMGKTFSCDKCGVAYVSRLTRDKHRVQCGGEDHPDERRLIDCLEPDCHARFTTYLNMTLHMQRDHDKDIDIKEFSFADMDEFNKWREYIQLTDFSYMNRRPCKKKKNGVIYVQYVCHFNCGSGSTAKRRQQLAAGMEYTRCPARMFVRIHNDVRVKYYSQHNHELSADNVRWYHRHPKSVLRYIEQCLELGQTPKQVYDSLNEEQNGMVQLDEESGIVSVERTESYRVPLSTIQSMWYRMTKQKRTAMLEENAVSADDNIIVFVNSNF